MGDRAAPDDLGRPIVAAFDVDGTVTVRDCVVPFLRQVGGTVPMAAGSGCGRTASSAPSCGVIATG